MAKANFASGRMTGKKKGSGEMGEPVRLRPGQASSTSVGWAGEEAKTTTEADPLGG